MTRHEQCHTVLASATLARRGLIEFILCLDHREILGEHNRKPEPVAAGSTNDTRSV